MRNEQPSTSLTLIDGLKQEDSLAWSRFVAIYEPLIRYWILQAGVAVHQSDDLIQEVLMAISKSIATFEHSPTKAQSLRPWMWGIARNKIGEFWRAEARRVISPGGSRALATLNALPEIPYEDSDLKSGPRIRKELAARAVAILKSVFEEKTWMAFERTVMFGCETRMVADELGMTTTAVRQCRFRVLKRLRAELGDDLFAGSLL